MKKIYISSVGGNATFLLNLPPAPNGLIYQKDVEVIAELGKFIKGAFSKNLVETAELRASTVLEGFEIDHVRTEGYGKYFRSPDDVINVEILINWKQEQKIRYIVLQECIKESQRIERFNVKYQNAGGEEKRIYTGTTVGYKKIIELDEEICTSKLSITIEDARIYPTLAFLGVYSLYSM